MNHKFVIKKGDVLKTYYNFEDIPNEFDHVIEFLPYIPPPPHSDEQHDEINSWLGKFQKLMDIERSRWNR